MTRERSICFAKTRKFDFVHSVIVLLIFWLLIGIISQAVNTYYQQSGKASKTVTESAVYQCPKSDSDYFVYDGEMYDCDDFVGGFSE